LAACPNILLEPKIRMKKASSQVGLGLIKLIVIKQGLRSD
jgi:hypothetical protein